MKRPSTENSKAEVISDRCAILDSETALSSFNHQQKIVRREHTSETSQVEGHEEFCRVEREQLEIRKFGQGKI
jgi:hypothetical protein